MFFCAPLQARARPCREGSVSLNRVRRWVGRVCGQDRLVRGADALGLLPHGKRGANGVAVICDRWILLLGEKEFVFAVVVVVVMVMLAVVVVAVFASPLGKL